MMEEHTTPHDTRHSLLLSLLVVVIFDSTVMLFSPWVRGGGAGEGVRFRYDINEKSVYS